MECGASIITSIDHDPLCCHYPEPGSICFCDICLTQPAELWSSCLHPHAAWVRLCAKCHDGVIAHGIVVKTI